MNISRRPRLLITKYKNSLFFKKTRLALINRYSDLTKNLREDRKKPVSLPKLRTIIQITRNS